MGIEMIGAAVMAMLIAAPLLIDRYLRELPTAPACPCCRATAREIQRSSPLGMIPGFGPTFLAECIRCGWSGRMRWKWARNVIRRK